MSVIFVKKKEDKEANYVIHLIQDGWRVRYYDLTTKVKCRKSSRDY